MPGYSIGQVVLSTGLTERQIRYCEEKGYIQPDRTPGGHRIFCEKDVLRLARLAELRRKGKSLNNALQVLQKDPAQTLSKNTEPSAVSLFFGLPPKERRL